MPCVYVLYSKKLDKRYVGSSRKSKPNTRLLSHNSGKTRSTKAGRPWIIIYWEHYIDYTSARKREIFLKSGQGRKFLDETIS